MKEIILDTNFLLSCLKFKIDFISEIKRISKFSYELCTLSGVLKELEGKKFGNLALQIIKDKKINIIGSEDYVDNEILNLKGDYVIATNNKRLIKKLKFPVIRIKQKKYLIINV